MAEHEYFLIDYLMSAHINIFSASIIYQHICPLCYSAYSLLHFI